MTVWPSNRIMGEIRFEIFNATLHRARSRHRGAAAGRCAPAASRWASMHGFANILGV